MSILLYLWETDAPRRRIACQKGSTLQFARQSVRARIVSLSTTRSAVQGRQVNGAKAPVVAARCTCLHDGRQGQCRSRCWPIRDWNVEG